MYTNYLAGLLLTPLFLSLVAFILRWFKKPSMQVAETIHLANISLVLNLNIPYDFKVCSPKGMSASSTIGYWWMLLALYS